MPSFLKEFFPVVSKRVEAHGKESNYCKYDNQGLQLFTSSLYLAALTSTFFCVGHHQKARQKANHVACWDVLHNWNYS